MVVEKTEVDLNIPHVEENAFLFDKDSRKVPTQSKEMEGISFIFLKNIRITCYG